MFDLLYRAFISPIDYSSVLRRRTLTLKERIDEGNNIFSFIFSFESPMDWKAGQHGLFFFKGKRVIGKAWRAFSIASSPLEKEVRITTQIAEAPSDFKVKLKALTPGEQMYLMGPFGEFHLDKCGEEIVGIAGGIGITPFRSLMYSASKTCPTMHLTLIYAGKNGNHTFRDTLDEIAAKDPNINLIYVSSPEEVTAALNREIEKKGNRAQYFVSGSPGMIAGITRALRRKGIKRIVNDPFKGY